MKGAKLRFLVFCSLAFVYPSISFAFANLQFELKKDFPRLEWSDKESVEQNLKKQKGYKRNMILMKKAYHEKDYKACARFGKKVSRLQVAVAPWVLALEVQCLVYSVEDKKSPLIDLVRALDFLNTKTDWMLVGSYSGTLKKSWADGYMLALKIYSKLNTKRAMAYLNRIVQHKAWLSDDQLAEAFKIAGEIALTQQRYLASKDYFQRSLLLRPNSKLEAQLRKVEERLSPSKKGDESAVVQVNEELEASEEEVKLVKEISSALEGGDLVNGIEIAIDLMEKFPGGLRAKWAADRVHSVFDKILDKEDKNFQLIEKRVMKAIEDAQVVHLIEWSRRLYWNGHYKESYDIAKLAAREIDKYQVNAEELNSLARSAYAVGNWSEARKLYRKLFREFAGTEESREALFRLGLIAVRKKQYSEARGHFERLLVIPNSEEYELRARYWLWRSLENTDKEDAQNVAKDLISRFPLSYYGLRAHAEMNEGKVIKLGASQIKDSNYSSRLNVTDSEKASIDRIGVLVTVGWHEEAGKEIESLPVHSIAELKVMMAKYWAASSNDLQAIITVNRLWDDHPSLVDKELIEIAYPKDLLPTITPEAKNHNLKPVVVMSLIRQESAFNKRAVSSSGALGLMQMIPPTAREVANDLGVKKLDLPEDLFDPVRNIQFGTHYLKKMSEKFEGHLPLSFAAYNAGPHRLKKWMETRKISPEISIDPHEELWVEELPWAETRFYVKAILRNILIYSFLDAGPVEIAGPFWAKLNNAPTSEAKVAD